MSTLAVVVMVNRFALDRSPNFLCQIPKLIIICLDPPLLMMLFVVHYHGNVHIKNDDDLYWMMMLMETMMMLMMMMITMTVARWKRMTNKSILSKLLQSAQHWDFYANQNLHWIFPSKILQNLEKYDRCWLHDADLAICEKLEFLKSSKMLTDAHCWWGWDW